MAQMHEMANFIVTDSFREALKRQDLAAVDMLRSAAHTNKNTGKIRITIHLLRNIVIIVFQINIQFMILKMLKYFLFIVDSMKDQKIILNF